MTGVQTGLLVGFTPVRGLLLRAKTFGFGGQARLGSRAVRRTD